MDNFGILIAQFQRYCCSLVFQKNCKNGIVVDFRKVPSNFSKVRREMGTKTVPILLTFFIFVAAHPLGADDVNWVKNTSNYEGTIKPDKNAVLFQKKGAPASESSKVLTKLKARFPSTISSSPSDSGPIMGTAVLGVSFLNALKELKKLPLTDSLCKVIHPYEFFQDPWKDSLLSPRLNHDPDSSSSDLAQPVLRRYLNPNGDKYFEEGKTRSIFKLLQFKREEIFSEIFMGFRFSFGSKSTPMLVEMNISPFPDKGTGFIIAF